jgi:hypothetical protein
MHCPGEPRQGEDILDLNSVPPLGYKSGIVNLLGFETIIRHVAKLALGLSWLERVVIEQSIKTLRATVVSVAQSPQWSQ